MFLADDGQAPPLYVKGPGHAWGALHGTESLGPGAQIRRWKVRVVLVVVVVVVVIALVVVWAWVGGRGVVAWWFPWNGNSHAALLLPAHRSGFLQHKLSGTPGGKRTAIRCGRGARQGPKGQALPVCCRNAAKF